MAFVAQGKYKGKLVSIVDIIDQTRVLVDGPESGVPRQEMKNNDIQLTKFKIPFAHSATTKTVRKAWKAGEVDKKWQESSWFRRLQNTIKRRAMTDFDRFKLRNARLHRNGFRKQHYRRILKKNIKAGCFNRKGKAATAKWNAEMRAKEAKALAAKAAAKK